MLPTHQWLLLAASLPGAKANAARVRLWRTLKEIGAANLRDGLALVPASSATRERMGEVVAQVIKHSGSAWLFEMAPQSVGTEAEPIRKFDRAEAYDEAVGRTQELAKLRTAVDRRFSSEEPVAAAGAIVHRDRTAFRKQCWATRKRLWVDRAASAWPTVRPERGALISTVRRSLTWVTV